MGSITKNIVTRIEFKKAAKDGVIFFKLIFFYLKKKLKNSYLINTLKKN